LDVASFPPPPRRGRQADCIVFAKIFSVQSPPFAKAKRGSSLSSNLLIIQRILRLFAF